MCNRIGGVMVTVLASSSLCRGFEPRSGQAKNKKIGICCFFAKQASLRRKSKDWLARNQDNVSEWGDVSIRGLLFQWASTMKIQLSVLVYSTKRTVSSSHWTLICSRHDIAKKKWWVGVKQQSLILLQPMTHILSVVRHHPIGQL